MSYPYDRVAAEPGGMECLECGVIFVGSAAHDQCAVCANNGWMPIETAPKHEDILVWVRGDIYQAAWAFANMMGSTGPVYGWMSNGSQLNTPTHWQPLLKPAVSER